MCVSTSTDDNTHQHGDEIAPCTQNKYIILICMVILISFGIKLRAWTEQYDLFHNVYIIVLSTIGIAWILALWVDIHLTKRRLKYADNSSNVTNKEWINYTYLKTPHFYCFYLKVGLSIFCLIHLTLTTTLITQEIYYFTSAYYCFDGLRLYASTVDMVLSLLQLFFIQNHSNIVINRRKCISYIGSMILITIAILKWFTTIAVESNFTSTSIRPKSPQIIHFKNRNPLSCAPVSVYNVNIANFLPYIDPFTIEFNFLCAIQWLIIWQHIGHYNETRASDYWSITEALESNDGLDEIAESIMCHKSGRGLFAGIFCFLGCLISLIYYFASLGYPNTSLSTQFFVQWEDFIYLTASFFSIVIATAQMTRLGQAPENCIGTTDLILLFIPLIAYAIRGYVQIIEINENGTNFIDRPLEVLRLVQPLFQSIFIFYAKSKSCDTIYQSQQKPGRQIITLLIALNLVLWVSGAFRSKAKLSHHNENHIIHTILLDICQPFILFYRYHSSVCLANIWKIVYSN